MHKSSMKAMRKFFDEYLDSNKEYSIIDIGSMGRDHKRVTPNLPVYPNYRHLIKNDKWHYQGLDLAKGYNVDIVAKGLYDFGVDSGSYDVVISGQCAEHVQDLKLWMVEVARIIKPGGLTCIIAPRLCTYHKHPIDCWRIYPDGMRWLLEDAAKLEVLYISEPPQILKSWRRAKRAAVSKIREAEIDQVGIARKFKIAKQQGDI